MCRRMKVQKRVHKGVDTEPVPCYILIMEPVPIPGIKKGDT